MHRTLLRNIPKKQVCSCWPCLQDSVLLKLWYSFHEPSTINQMVSTKESSAINIKDIGLNKGMFAHKGGSHWKNYYWYVYTHLLIEVIDLFKGIMLLRVYVKPFPINLVKFKIEQYSSKDWTHSFIHIHCKLCFVHYNRTTSWQYPCDPGAQDILHGKF